jgi:hypothetical protein
VSFGKGECHHNRARAPQTERTGGEVPDTMTNWGTLLADCGGVLRLEIESAGRGWGLQTRAEGASKCPIYKISLKIQAVSRTVSSISKKAASCAAFTPLP